MVFNLVQAGIVKVLWFYLIGNNLKRNRNRFSNRKVSIYIFGTRCVSIMRFWFVIWSKCDWQTFRCGSLSHLPATQAADTLRLLVKITVNTHNVVGWYCWNSTKTTTLQLANFAVQIRIGQKKLLCTVWGINFHGWLGGDAGGGVSVGVGSGWWSCSSVQLWTVQLCTNTIYIIVVYMTTLRRQEQIVRSFQNKSVHHFENSSKQKQTSTTRKC